MTTAEQGTIWSRAMPLPRAAGRRGVGPAWGELTLLRGVVDRIVYQGGDDGFTIARAVPDGALPDEPAGAGPGTLNGDGTATLAGPMPELLAGEAIEARGWWRHDQRRGWSFRVVDYRTTLPATVEGIRRYLASGLVKGIGPVIAGRIVDAFGAETLATIDGAPERLRQIAGIGPIRAERVATAWAEHRQIHDVMVALQSYGVTTALAVRIYKKLGKASVRTITTDPFRLAREVAGIGFKTADKIARAIGVVPDAPERVRAAVLHALRELAMRGDTRVPEEALGAAATALLGLPDAPVGQAVADLIGRRQIAATAVADGSRLLADARLAAAEAGIAERLERLLAEDGRTLLGHAAAHRDWSQLFQPAEGADPSGQPLSEEQDRAVRTALKAPVSIVTGGPGTGKTHSVRALLEAARSVGARVLLAAPTGRAARRLNEATGAEARTVHRLLELRFGGSAARGPANPLAADCLVVDEASMLDVPLAHRLLRAVAPGSHLVLVGDPDQLPSVGPGNVLGDLIASDRIPVARLTHVFRHGAGSGIALAAQAVNRGRVPPPRAPSGDYFFLRRADPEAAAETVVKLVSERIPARLGCAPGDVQVLAPMHRGAVGVAALNARLQQALNPKRDGLREVRSHGRLFREGDRVLQLRNDYQLGVFNGEMGTISFIDPDEHEVGVTLEDGRTIRYPWASLSALTHAFATSVHKGQGAEFPAVVVVMTTTHAVALSRTLFYTALTRAREMVVVVGQEKAVEMAVDNWNSRRRLTALGELLAAPVARAIAEADALAEQDDPAFWDAFSPDEDDRPDPPAAGR
ncbi:MAG TPA: ATP-dependent RecD-like DNA helicase [Chloroflexota bacterium]